MLSYHLENHVIFVSSQSLKSGDKVEHISATTHDAEYLFSLIIAMTTLVTLIVSEGASLSKRKQKATALAVFAGTCMSDMKYIGIVRMSSSFCSKMM